MLTALIILLALAAVAFLVLKKKDNGKEVSREEFAADIRKFIDGSATALDWDDFVTFSLRDVELESLRQQCLDALLEAKSKQVKPWLSDEALRTLTSVLSRLEKKPIQSITDQRASRVADC
jgi:hypothetical protein